LGFDGKKAIKDNSFKRKESFAVDAPAADLEDAGRLSIARPRSAIGSQIRYRELLQAFGRGGINGVETFDGRAKEIWL